jgi:hypothetical protein
MELEQRLKSLRIGDKEQLGDLYRDFPNDRNTITEYVEALLKRATKELDAKIDEISVRVQLAQYIEMLPLAYISRCYFNRTKSWLYQRINGNIVNGASAKFTDGEKDVFNSALQDISKRIGSINIA